MRNAAFCGVAHIASHKATMTSTTASASARVLLLMRARRTQLARWAPELSRLVPSVTFALCSCQSRHTAAPRCAPLSTTTRVAAAAEQTPKKKKGAKKGGMGGQYSDTLCLPATAFPMRANAAQREPMIQKHCFGGTYSALSSRKGPLFILHDGPPFANGALHMGHILNKVLKDMIVRFKAIRGHQISFIPGWDTHGLPIEAKAVASTTPTDAEQAGSRSGKGQPVTIKSDPRRIRQAARKFALKAIKDQKADFVRMGVMADWEHPYVTLDPHYEAQQLSVFLKMMQAGLVQRRYRPVYWSPSSQTALAEAEIEYHDHASTSVFVKLGIAPGAALRDAFAQAPSPPNPTATEPRIAMAIWTTTPWTLPANQAVGVHEGLDYLAIPRSDGTDHAEYLIVADSCLERCMPFLQSCSYAPERAVRVKGAALLDSTYQHPVDPNRSCPIFHSDHVSSDAGIFEF